MLTLQPEIAQAMIYGDRRPHLVALLVPEAEIADAPDVQQRLAAAVDRVNAEVSVIERSAASSSPTSRSRSRTSR
jgi:long-chain acyl-CoA synthetase